MSYERETIQRIQSEVDRHDKHQQLYGGEVAIIGVPSDTIEPRIVLCSGVGPHLTVSSYGIILSEDLGIEDFATHLHNLLQGRVDSNVKFHQVSCQIDHYLYITYIILQIKTYSACRLSYPCQVTGDLQREIFHATSTWQNSGPRYDSVIVQGQRRSSLFFAEVHALFSISVDSKTFGVAIIKPFTRKPRNTLTNYIEELEGPKEGYFDFCFIDSIIRTVHILPPTPHNHRFVVQDLTDGDIYLRLIHLK